jgi:hypothetical protein
MANLQPEQGRKLIDKDETPESRFERLADLSTNNALDEIRLLKNLTSSQYKSDTAYWDMIITALFDAVSGLDMARNSPQK